MMMVNGLKYMVAFALAFALMLGFRTLVFSVHSVNGDALAPLYHHGDQLLVNRCSYGLRIAGHGLLPYTRLLSQPVKKGDIVVFTVPSDSLAGIFIARCMAVPGDTVNTLKGSLVVPGRKTCANADYYWLEGVNPTNPADSRHLGFISERDILGRVVTTLYNRQQLR
jgi:signal peptidase I